jgi:hypothetical protein
VEGVNDLFSIGSGSYGSGGIPGQFVRAGDDKYQGLVASFSTVDLDANGEFLQAEFLWGGGGGNNAGQQVLLGLFDGPVANGHAQRQNTDAWSGYFFALGTRLSSDGDTPYGVYWQGPGEIPIFNHVVQDSFPAFSVNGVSHRVTSGLRPPLRNDSPRRVILTARRLAANQMEVIINYRTTRSDGNQSSSFSSLDRQVQLTASTSNFQATIRSVWALPSGTPMRFSGIAMAAAETFIMSGLKVETGMPAPVSVGLGSLPAATTMPSLPASAIPAAISLPASEINSISFAQAMTLPQGSTGAAAQTFHLPTLQSRSLREIADAENNSPN